MGEEYSTLKFALPIYWLIIEQIVIHMRLLSDDHTVYRHLWKSFVGMHKIVYLVELLDNKNPSC